MTMTLHEYIERKGADRQLLAAMTATLPSLLAEMPVGAVVSADEVLIGDDELRIDSFAVTDDAADTMRCYGHLLDYVISQAEWSPKMLKTVAQGCREGRYADIRAVCIDIEKRTARPLFVILIAVLVGALALLAWLYVRA